jgi:cation:H+ antiporter
VILIWLGVMVAGFGVAMIASNRAVHYGSALAQGTKIPPFIIGITLFAVGTDLPEIANSIIASATGHGDINVGDSLASALVQSTLILGLLPILTVAFTVRGRMEVIGAATVIALIGVAALVADGHLGRVDGALLLTGWVIGSLVAWRYVPALSAPVLPVSTRKAAYNGGAALVALAIVGGGAALAIWAVVRLAALIEVSEYTIAFFVASIGTSLPELIVGVTALRRGERDLGVGDIIGASFVDSTLSIGIGPLLFPVVVTASDAVTGAVVGAAMIAAVVILLSLRKIHDWRTGLVLIALYLAAYAIILG